MNSLIRQLLINKYRIKAPNVKIGFLSRIGDGSLFEGNNRIGKLSFFQGSLGKFSYVGNNVRIIGCLVGRYTSISSNVHIVNGKHPITHPFVSTSPVFYSRSNPLGCTIVQEQLFEEYAYVDEKKKIQIIIGNDCWIGYGVSIVGGVSIGDGAVILANATVTKDVPSYAIVGGVPAKILGYRYDEMTRNALISKLWWNKEDSWIKENAYAFSDINHFLTL